MHEQVKIIVLVLLLNSGLLAPAAMRAEPATDVSRQLVGAEALPNVPGHKLTAVTIELGPGISVPSHVHDGFVFVYVLEGSIRSQLDDAEAIDYRSGDGTDKLTSADKHNLANFVQATTAFHSLNALILRLL